MGVTRSTVQDWLTDDGLTQLMGWSRDGLTVDDIAHNIGIGTRTLYDWMKRHPQISQSIKAGRAPADVRVENALYQRAVGYEWTEVSETVFPDGTKETRKVTRYVPGSVPAEIFWLKNRKPTVWKDRRDELTQEEAAECGVVILPARTEGLDE